MDPVVDAEWLEDHLDSVVVADVRWYLSGRSGPAAYQAGHVPTSVFVDVDHCLAAPPSPAAGRHPLPDPDSFAACMSGNGIGDGTVVVAYDDTGGSTAARLVWMLRVLGEQAALLDGGLAAWTGPLETVARRAPPASFTPRPWPRERLALIDEVASGGLALVDARAGDRYRGDAEPIDARAGHIPGAVNLAWAGNLDPVTSRFRSPAELRDRFAPVASSDVDVAVYCGSGVTACHDLLAIERAGFPPARLYAGAWSQWAADPSRPIGTGSEP